MNAEKWPVCNSPGENGPVWRTSLGVVSPKHAGEQMGLVGPGCRGENLEAGAGGSVRLWEGFGRAQPPVPSRSPPGACLCTAASRGQRGRAGLAPRTAPGSGARRVRRALSAEPLQGVPHPLGTTREAEPGPGCEERAGGAASCRQGWGERERRRPAPCPDL